MSAWGVAAAFGGALVAAGLAWRMRLLTAPAAVLAAAIGLTVAWQAGWSMVLPLLVAFIGSSGLSALPGRLAAEASTERQGRRVSQVLANAGPAWLLAVLAMLWPWDLWYPAYVTALAALAADTWATELGGRYGGAPRSIISWRRLTAGESGAVSAIGFLASAAGAGSVLASSWWWLPAGQQFLFFGVMLVSACLGAVVDSLLGATVQARFHCPVCHRRVEQRHHCAGQETDLVSGISWVRNDVVNILGITAGIMLSLVLLQVFLSA